MRAQATMELSVMLLFSMIVMAVLLIIVSYYNFAITQERSQTKANDIADLLQKELLIAASVPNGYERTVILPNTIGPYTYNIAISNRLITITLSNNQVANRYIPQVSGSFGVGENLIQKHDNQIMVS